MCDPHTKHSWEIEQDEEVPIIFMSPRLERDILELTERKAFPLMTPVEERLGRFKFPSIDEGRFEVSGRSEDERRALGFEKERRSLGPLELAEGRERMDYYPIQQTIIQPLLPSAYSTLHDAQSPARMIIPLTPSQPPPPTPSSTTPANMTGLLHEVLGIMNGIMDQQAIVQEEDDVLTHLTELVVIMQQEAEDLLALADLVEQYVEEIDVAEQVAEIEEWVEELDLDGIRKTSSPEFKGHERGDSAVGLEEDALEDEHAGELRESMFREVPIVQYQSPEIVNITPIMTGALPVSPLGRDTTSKSRSDATGHVPTIGISRPKRGKLKKPPQTFRDSGLDLRSPIGSQSSQRRKTR